MPHGWVLSEVALAEDLVHHARLAWLLAAQTHLLLAPVGIDGADSILEASDFEVDTWVTIFTHVVYH